MSSATGLITDWPLQAAICLIGGPFIGYQFGRWAGKEILVKNKNAFLLSLAIGFASVLLTTLLFSSLAFITEGLFSSFSIGDEAFNYIAKPVYWTCVFPSPLIVLVAGIMALFFRRARNEHFSTR